jgi:hypothetical protein
VISGGAMDRIEADAELQKLLVYSSGVLVQHAIASNLSKKAKFPRYREFFRDREKQSPEDMLRAMKGYTASIEAAEKRRKGG